MSIYGRMPVAAAGGTTKSQLQQSLSLKRSVQAAFDGKSTPKLCWVLTIEYWSIDSLTFLFASRHIHI